MDNSTENTLNNPEEIKIVYGKFFPRLAAGLIDSLIMAPLILIESKYNVTHLKSIPFLIFCYLIIYSYKPVMEYYFGATIGKITLDLKVVNYDNNKPNLQEILLRNIFHIGSGIIILSLSIYVFSTPEFEHVSTIKEYRALSGSIIKYASEFFLFIVSLTEIIFLLSDKKCRALHDRIGKTYVINHKKSKLQTVAVAAD